MFLSGKIFRYLLILYILLNISWSTFQHYKTPLWGDVADISVPKEWYKKVLEEPFGIKAISENISYAATNRYFIHALHYHYFRHAPPLFQKFTSGPESLYYSTAFFKIGIQILLILILGRYIFYSYYPLDNNKLLILALLFSLFQNGKFGKFIGIIDESITYAMFYSAPTFLFLLFFAPFVLRWRSADSNIDIHWSTVLYSLIILCPLSLGGPIIPPLVLIIGGFLWLRIFYLSPNKINLWQSKKFLLISCALLMNLYSFYLGLFNAENENSIPLFDRLLLLPQGLFHWGFTKIITPLLITATLISLRMYKKFIQEEFDTYKWPIIWLFSFCLIYVCLLPFGGYRDYRPYIIRYDVMIPVTLILMGTLSFSIYRILLQKKHSQYATFFTIGLIAIFSYTDSSLANTHDCEKKNIQTIVEAPTRPVPLENECPTLDWTYTSQDPQWSRLRAEFLQLTGVTDSVKLFYYKPRDNK